MSVAGTRVKPSIDSSVPVMMVVVTVAKPGEGFEVEHGREVVEVEHFVRLAVLAEERRVFTKPQILHEERDVAAVAALDALAELGAQFVGVAILAV